MPTSPPHPAAPPTPALRACASPPPGPHTSHGPSPAAAARRMRFTTQVFVFFVFLGPQSGPVLACTNCLPCCAVAVMYACLACSPACRPLYSQTGLGCTPLLLFVLSLPLFCTRLARSTYPAYPTTMTHGAVPAIFPVRLFAGHAMLVPPRSGPLARLFAQRTLLPQQTSPTPPPQPHFLRGWPRSDASSAHAQPYHGWQPFCLV